MSKLTELKNFNVSGWQIDGDAALKLNIADIFKSDSDIKCMALVLSALIYNDDQQDTLQDDDHFLKSKVNGCGLQIIFKFEKFNNNSSLSIYQIIAAVRCGITNAEYEINTFGLGPNALPAILNGLSKTAELVKGSDITDDFVTKLKTIYKNLVQYIETLNNTDIDLENIDVIIEEKQEDIFKVTQSMLFSVNCIKQGLSLREALNFNKTNFSDGYSEEMIKQTYFYILGTEDDDVKPSESQKVKTDKLL